MFEPTLCVRVSSYTHTCVGPCSTNLKLWVDSAFLGDIQEQEAIPMGSILTWFTKMVPQEDELGACGPELPPLTSLCAPGRAGEMGSCQGRVHLHGWQA